MHIPYGLLSPEVSVATAVLAAPAVGWSLWRVRRRRQEKTIPLIGVLGAYIFAAQMLNFPVAAGTSGHLLGAALAVFTLGPAAAVLILSTVVTIQAVLFQDGAVTALGANILNMAVVGVLVPWLFFGLWRRLFRGRQALLGMATAALASIVAAAAVCAVEIAASGIYPLATVLGAMTGIHALIGVVEAVITAAILRFLRTVRPDLVPALVPEGEAPHAATLVG
jgi:cobalt/nickel transport system permease protein